MTLSQQFNQLSDRDKATITGIVATLEGNRLGARSQLTIRRFTDAERDAIFAEAGELSGFAREYYEAYYAGICKAKREVDLPV